MEYCLHEDNEFEFYLEEEDDYPSCCDENGDHLEKEDEIY